MRKPLYKLTIDSRTAGRVKPLRDSLELPPAPLTPASP